MMFSISKLTVGFILIYLINCVHALINNPTEIFTSTELPEPGFIPNLGNGHIAYDVGCPNNGDETSSAGYLFAAGVYSGVGTETPSKRALVPQFLAVYVTHAELSISSSELVDHVWEAKLDIRRGTFTNTSSFTVKRINSVSKSNEIYTCNISLTWFVHRKEKGLSVLHLETSMEHSDTDISNICEFSLSTCNGEMNDENVKQIDQQILSTKLDISNCYADMDENLEEVEMTAYMYETTEAETSTSGLSQVFITGSLLPSTITSSSTSSSGCYTAYMNTDSSTWHRKDPKQAGKHMDLFNVDMFVSELTAKYINYASIYDAHVDTWSQLWESGIEISGNKTIASSVNASLYYILSAVDGSSAWSVSPGGLAKNSYNGHVFWDCETWMLPALAPLYPEITAAFGDYRIERLEAAKTRALERGFSGAMFPWESATTGSDVTPDPNTEGEYEIHVTADIALAIRLVSQWRGGDLDDYIRNNSHTNANAQSIDKARLASEWELIRACCEYLAQRVACVHYINNTCELYTYYDVMPPDEQAGVVNSSVYTNAASVELFMWISDLLSNSTIKQDVIDGALWKTIAERMYIPLSNELDDVLIHPEFEGYAGQAINQADVILLQYPLQYSGVGVHTLSGNTTNVSIGTSGFGIDMNSDGKPITPLSMDEISYNDLQYYAARTSVPGETKGFYTGDSSYSIAYLGLYRNGFQPTSTDSEENPDKLIELANEQFEIAFEHMDLTKYYVWKEKVEGGHFNFITGAGGYIQNVLYGYGGIAMDYTSKIHGFLLNYPVLPPNGVNCMKIRRIHFDNTIFTMEYYNNNTLINGSFNNIDNIITITVHSGNIRIYRVMEGVGVGIGSNSNSEKLSMVYEIVHENETLHMKNGKYKIVSL